MGLAERSIYIPGGRLQGVAQELGRKLAHLEPWVEPAPPPEGPTVRHMAAAGELMLGLVVLLFFIP